MNKISVMHLTYDMRIGGTEMVIKNLIEGSDAKRFEMSIFCIEQPIGPWGKELQEGGTPIARKARKPGFDISLISTIRKHVKQHQVDVLHCHQYTPWVYAVLAAIGTKAKVIFTEHGRFYPDVSSWKRKLINPWLCKITQHITAISKATKQALVEYENIPEDRISVVYNGIKPLKANAAKVHSLRSELGIDKQAYIFGTVARLDPIKNHQMMLKAFKKVHEQHPEAVLIIVGDGEEKQNIIHTIERLNLQKQVILPGYQTNPTDYLALFDVFLLSSFSEGTSMTLLESMSLNKPCVVTDAGGNKEIIINGENGFVSPNDHTHEFAQSMLKLIAAPELVANMATAAGNRFARHFASQIMNSAYQTLYSDSNK